MDVHVHVKVHCGIQTIITPSHSTLQGNNLGPGEVLNTTLWTTILCYNLPNAGFAYDRNFLWRITPWSMNTI